MCVRLCACVHTESILLNPVPHCLNTSLEYLHCHNWILFLSLLVAAGFGSGVAGRLGLPPIRPSDWLVQFIPPKSVVPVWRFLWMGLEWWSTQGYVVSGLFFKGGHMIWLIFPVAATYKFFLLFLFCIVFLHILIVSDQVLLPSDLLFKDCFSSHTHWHQAWPKQDWDTFSTELEIHKFLYEVQLWSLSSFKYFKSVSGAWFVFICEASSSVWDKSSATSSSNIWKYIQTHTVARSY